MDTFLFSRSLRLNSRFFYFKNIFFFFHFFFHFFIQSKGSQARITESARYVLLKLNKLLVIFLTLLNNTAIAYHQNREALQDFLDAEILKVQIGFMLLCIWGGDTAQQQDRECTSSFWDDCPEMGIPVVD